MKNKKAQVSLLVWIIFASCLILLLVWFFFVRVSPQTTRAVNLEACRTTVKTASAMRQKTSVVPPVTLNCPAPASEYDTLKEKEKVNIMKIATELSNCWYKTFAEKNRLGKSHGGFLFFEWDFLSKDPNVCIVCSTFNVTAPVPTIDIVEYITEKNLLEGVGWPESYFIDLTYEEEERYSVAPIYTVTYGIERLETLEPGEKYYVVDLHAPMVSEEYVHVFVFSVDDLPLIHNVCDIFFYEMAKT